MPADALLSPPVATDALATPGAPAWAEVDLAAVVHNARVLRARAPEAEFMAVVKANAYGHGAAAVARALASDGVRRFAVANVREGAELRAAGVREPTLVLGAPYDPDLATYAAFGLTVTVTSPDVARAVVASGARLTVHLKVDTGMNRLGVEPADVPAVLSALRGAPGVTVEGLMTHFATVDAVFTNRQAERFDALVHALGDAAPPLVHVSNSGTLLVRPGLVASRPLVRAGGALYGLVSDRIAEAPAAGLRAAMRLVSRIVHVQTVDAGEAVSYGRTWTAVRPTRVGVVGCGYGDGYPRALSNRGVVGVGGRMVPVVGRVCMDMTLLDLGAPGGPGDRVRRGDEAVLFGAGGPAALAVAEQAGTIAYELTCGLTPRVPRLTAGA